jgi:hypothetical protein
LLKQVVVRAGYLLLWGIRRKRRTRMKRSSTGDKEQLFSDDRDRKGEDQQEGKRTSSAPAQIMNPLASDILLGRGKPYQEHLGNVRFLRVINLYRDRYFGTQTRREDKALIADEIINLFKTKRKYAIPVPSFDKCTSATTELAIPSYYWDKPRTTRAPVHS